MFALRRQPLSSRPISLSSLYHSRNTRYAQNIFRGNTKPLFITHLSRNASTANASPTGKGTSNRALTMIAGLAVLSVSYSLGVLYPPNIYTLIYPREAPARAADGSRQAQEEAKKLESALWEIPIVKQLVKTSYPLNADTVPSKFLGPAGVNNTRKYDGTADPTLTHYMARPYVNLPESFGQHSLTAGLLQGPGRIAIPPLLFIQTDEKALTGVIHLGRSICGHDGIVHGGLIATLFDDSFFRTAVANFPARIGVTAWIRIDYKAPTRADQFVVFKTKVDKVDGRKVYLSGWMEDLEGNVLVQAESLFVQPRYAHLIQSEEREKHFLHRPAAIARTLEPVAETAGTK